MLIPNMSSVMLGKSVLFCNSNICIKSGTIFFRPDLRRLPSQQTLNIWYVPVANMLENNPAVRNIGEILLRLHKLRCIPILTLHFHYGSHSPPRRLHSSRVRPVLPYAAESQNSPLVTSGRLERPRSARVSGYIWASGDVLMGHRWKWFWDFRVWLVVKVVRQFDRPQSSGS